MMEKREAMLRWVGLALYGLAGLGVAMAVLTLLAVRDNLRRNTATGDTAGAGLAMAFLLIGLVPMILVALVLALWLAPPRRRRSASDPDADGSGLGPVPSRSI